MKKFVVLFSAVGEHRRGKVVACHDIGGEEMAQLHLSRGAVREATPDEAGLDKVHLEVDGRPESRTLEEQIKKLTADNESLRVENERLSSEVFRLKTTVIEVPKPDDRLIGRIRELEKINADLMHRVRHNQPAPTEPAEKKK